MRAEPLVLASRRSQPARSAISRPDGARFTVRETYEGAILASQRPGIGGGDVGQMLMEHWRRVLPAGVVLEVRYEEVVADVEGQARQIIAYCGLEWDDACLDFYKTQRPIRTASATQVRQPIYRTSIGRWKSYLHLQQPLIKELGIELDEAE